MGHPSLQSKLQPGSMPTPLLHQPHLLLQVPHDLQTPQRNHHSPRMILLQHRRTRICSRANSSRRERLLSQCQLHRLRYHMPCATLIRQQVILTDSSRPENMLTRHGNRIGRRANNQASCVVAEKNRANNVPLRATTLPISQPLSLINAQDHHNLQHRDLLSQNRNLHHPCRPRLRVYRRRRKRCLQHYWLARTSCRQHPRHRRSTLCLMSKTNNQDVHSLMNRESVLNNSKNSRLKR